MNNLQTPLAIGTLQWGTTILDHKLINSKGVISETDASEIIRIASKAGVQVFDTAEGYGGGTSEKRLGRLLPPHYSDAIIMTKFLPAPWRYSHQCFENAVRASCVRLGVDCIPIYLLHSPVHWRPIEFWIEAAAICKKKGLIQAMGLSNCDADNVKRAHVAAKEYGIDIICNQVHFSMLCYKSEKLQDMVKVCRHLDICIVGFTPLGQGLLTDGMTEEKCESNRPAKMLKIQWNELSSLRDEIKRLAVKYDRSMAQICLNWSICHDILPLVGCRSPKQALDSVQAISGWKLTDSEVMSLDDVALDRSTFRSSKRKRMLFVTLFGVIMVVCRTLDMIGYGMVSEAGKII